MAKLFPGIKGRGESFKFNHKVMIIGFNSRHLILWSLENFMVCESLDKGANCARERRITPSTPYLIGMSKKIKKSIKQRKLKKEITEKTKP
jgi:hypothetical protein